MKFVSWNVNSVRVRLPLVQQMIRAEAPEVVMLQELKCRDEDFPYEAFPEYECHIWGQKSYNGVAVLTKKNLEIQSLERIHLGGTEEHSRCLKLNLKSCCLMCVYVPCGSTDGAMYEFKKNYLYDLNHFIKSLPDERLIIGGDFNVALTDADVQYPEDFEDGVLCLPEFRESMREILKNNLNDTVDPKQYTWWDYRAPNKGVRIDYILTRNLQGKQQTRAFYRRTKISDYQIIKNSKAKLVEVKPSDHVPVVLECSL